MEKTTSPRDVKFLKIVFMIVVGSILLPTSFKAIAVIIFALAISIVVLQEPLRFQLRPFLYATAFFMIAAATLLYSQDLSYGVKKLTTMLSLFIFPLLFCLLNKRLRDHFKSWKWDLFKVYVTTVVLFNVVPFIYLWITKYTFSEMLIHYTTVMRDHYGKFSIHPIYLSMHNSVAILFSFFLLIRKGSRKNVFLLLSANVVLILFLLLYAKKGPLIALCLMLFLALIFHRKRSFFKPYLLATAILIGLTICIPRTRNKFKELFIIENIDNGVMTSTNIRYTIYSTAVDLISQSPMYGYGIGDYKNELTQAYQTAGHEALFKAKFNAHNQFLSFLLIGGVLVLLPFLVYLLITTLLAIRYDNQILILLLIFYSVVMCTENILERESGVLYFALFISYFSLFNTKSA